jgi:hypothetical protein
MSNLRSRQSPGNILKLVVAILGKGGGEGGRVVRSILKKICSRKETTNASEKTGGTYFIAGSIACNSKPFGTRYKKVTRRKRRKHQQTTNNDSVVRNGGGAAAAAAAAAMVILVRSCPTLANVHGSTSTETFLVSWFSPPLFPNTQFFVP